MAEISQAISVTTNKEQLFDVLLQGLTLEQGLGFDRAVVLMVNEFSQILKGVKGALRNITVNESLSSNDFFLPPPKMLAVDDWEIPLRPDQGLLALAVLQKSPYLQQKNSKETVISPALYGKYTAQEFFVVPLVIKDQAIGVILVDNHMFSRPLESVLLDVLQMLSPVVAQKIEDIARFSDIGNIEPYILRSIEFSPEHHEMGMTILNYFGTVLRQKYPGMKVKVKIEQDDLMVRMIIQTEEGNIEKIERTLGEYGLVIKGEMPLEDFFSNPFEILQLKNQIKIACLQLENQKELLGLQKSLHGERINGLEEEVKWLRSHVANILISSQNNIKAIEEVMRGARKLLESRDEILESAISLIDKKLQEGITQDDLAEVKQALETIQDRSPSFFEQFIEKINVLIIQGSISGVAGNLLYDLLKSFSKMC